MGRSYTNLLYPIVFSVVAVFRHPCGVGTLDLGDPTGRGLILSTGSRTHPWLYAVTPAGLLFSNSDARS